jgi:glycosyltransferase involved in cell wall biosynthesis
MFMSQQELDRPRIAIDGVFFQIANLGIARVWKTLLHEWVESGFAKHLLVLDRDGTAPQIDGVNYCSIEKYEWDRTAQDSLELQKICDRHKIDLFMSTYFTTPISTPAILIVHDMVPEVMGMDLDIPMWQEKSYAIQYASKYIAVSQNTIYDLCRFYPQIDPQKNVTLARNGIDPLFIPSLATAIDRFQAKHRINKPYFLVVGDRVGFAAYKNVIHFFRAITELPDYHRYEIVCVGGASELEPELVELAIGIQVHRLDLADLELQAAYSGAIALVYPSLYEGFGLPILEAMACGCPVITCRNSALPEVAGDAAIYVSETDVTDLIYALKKVQEPKVRQQLIEVGLQQSRKFSWKKMADTIAIELLNAYTQLQQGQLPPINPLWHRFRQLQADSASELMATRAQLASIQSKIAATETTKFWQLRIQWLKLKHTIGLVERS